MWTNYIPLIHFFYKSINTILLMEIIITFNVMQIKSALGRHNFKQV